MTRSQAYAVERSRERNVPIVLFDEAEVALFMSDPGLFPRLPLMRLKGWNHIKTIALDTMSADEVDSQLLMMVTQSETTYGFAIVGGEGGSLQLGIFEMVPEDAEVVVVPFTGRARPRASL
jgi:hypothetical protein